MEFDQTFFINILIVVAAFALMKFMPRILAFGIPFVDARDVQARIENGDDVVVIDVRSESEYSSDTGHVPGALNLPVSDIHKRLEATAAESTDFKTHPVYLMCRTENRSSSAAKAMRRAGFQNVSVIKGGIGGWNKAGLPTEGKA